jgi:hypothetical protein
VSYWKRICHRPHLLKNPVNPAKSFLNNTITLRLFYKYCDQPAMEKRSSS